MNPFYVLVTNNLETIQDIEKVKLNVLMDISMAFSY